MTEPDQTDATADGDQSSAGEAAATGTARDRSTVKFPYTDIRDAVSVASVLHEKLGGAGEPGQLAAAMGQKLSSGSFRTKVATASTFGVIESKRGKITLLPLGYDMIDERTRQAALVKAFLAVELYQKLWVNWKDKILPSDGALESEIRDHGVLASQAGRARQAFIRSAEHAGFFWGGKNRLTLPPDATLNGSIDSDDERDEQKDEHRDRDRDSGERRPLKLSDAPLLKALWDTLPEGPDFTTEARKRFFTALAFNIDYVYGPPSDGGRLDPAGVAQLWTEAKPDSQSSAPVNG